ncbi:hypothetical protein C9374_013671 [Naegleria lovaniensis]|uniref:Isobutyryl-CoA dehydrogenase, mitochondrial n=1 Tax=Naegleria lovaniensis TaxID=51637 RepID=A0AA88KBL9_NAELO|nr:uncharacterized protein C9374_013671 [Naegleria lovaniensis]KAG2372663.1 hypothetical protein C9374_013671 [Naegleria lovaniensis]
MLKQSFIHLSSAINKQPSALQLLKKAVIIPFQQRFLSSANQELITHSEQFNLTPEQLEYQQLAKDFTNKHFQEHIVSEWDRNKTFPMETLREAAQLGFGGIYVSTDYGGTGLSRLDASIIFEQLAKGDVSTTAYLTIHNMCCWMIDQYGTPQQKERYLPALCSMEKFASYCLTEPNSGSDAASLRTRAVLSEDGESYVLNGEKAFISGGGSSDVYLVMAKVSNGTSSSKKEESSADAITCFIIEKNTPGLSFGKNEVKLGWNTQPTRAVIMDNVKVKKENILGEIGQGFKIAMQGLDGGRINIATCSVGGAQQCMNMAGEYLHTRKQFGKPLSNFQHLQFKLADMATRVHASRLMVRTAAAQLDMEKSSHSTTFCAMAKRFATDECFDVVNDSLQMFGGYGYLNEYGVERYLRDLRVHCILEGTNEVMRLITSRYYLNLYKGGQQ